MAHNPCRGAPIKAARAGKIRPDAVEGFVDNRWPGLLCVVALGCGAESLEPGPVKPPAPETAQLETPSVRLISPPTLTAGARVTVLGQDFADPAVGKTILVFSGFFRGESGGSSRVEMEVPAEYENPGRVELTFEVGYPPAAFGHQLGTFEGELRAVNRPLQGQGDLASAPLPVELEVGPSLAVWQVQPSSTSCSTDRVTRTLDGEELELSLEAIGLTPASASMPLRFSAEWVDFSGTPRALDELETATEYALMYLDFGALPVGQVSGTGYVSLTVQDGWGTTLSRAVSVDFARSRRVAYDGNVRIAELYAPVQVSSCIPGGTYGQNVSYTGGSAENRSRSVSLSANVGIDIWVLNVGFGISVTDTVSSDESESLSMSGTIYPHQYGVFYRQTQRLERQGVIMQRHVCGNDTVTGQAVVTDWNWAPDLAVTQNRQCPPAPPSNLPPAQVFP